MRTLLVASVCGVVLFCGCPAFAQEGAVVHDGGQDCRPLTFALPSAPERRARSSGQTWIDANGAARQRPEREGFVSARYVYTYAPGAIFELYANPNFISTILLEEGETLTNVAAGDTSRWQVSEASAESLTGFRTILLVKPAAAGLRTNIVLVTDRRTYLVEAVSQAGEAYSAEIAWCYPGGAGEQIPHTLVGALNFDYRVAERVLSGVRMPLLPNVITALVLTFSASRILGLAAQKRDTWQLRVAHLLSWLLSSALILGLFLDWRDPEDWLGTVALTGVCQLLWHRVDAPQRAPKGDGTFWIIIANLLVASATAAGALVVGIQLRENWRQAQLAYLQQRGQDFLDREYSADGSLGCLYDWWNARGPHESTTTDDSRCVAVMTNEAEYAKTMLYVEEVLMYFVEEARISCTNNVGYSRELEIWRNDVRDDVAGAFSYYIIYRFAAPEMRGYFMDVALRDTSAGGQLFRFVRMARLNGVSVNDLCRNMERFRDQLRVAGQQPPAHVVELCPAPEASLLSTDAAHCSSNDPVARFRACPIFDWQELQNRQGVQQYCRDVHHRRRSVMDTALDWVQRTLSGTQVS